MIDFVLFIDGRGGSGKSTLVKALNDHFGLEPTKNFTTRKPRFEGESGYFFVTEEEFISHFKQGKILECYYRDSSHALYGSSAPTQKGVYQGEIMANVALRKWCFEQDVPYCSIYLDVKTETLLQRLRARSDINEVPEIRLQEDAYYEIFKHWSDIVYDYNNKTIEEGLQEILKFMSERGIIG